MWAFSGWTSGIAWSRLAPVVVQFFSEEDFLSTFVWRRLIWRRSRHQRLFDHPRVQKQNFDIINANTLANFLQMSLTWVPQHPYSTNVLYADFEDIGLRMNAATSFIVASLREAQCPLQASFKLKSLPCHPAQPRLFTPWLERHLLKNHWNQRFLLSPIGWNGCQDKTRVKETRVTISFVFLLHPLTWKYIEDNRENRQKRAEKNLFYMKFASIHLSHASQCCKQQWRRNFMYLTEI